MRQNSSDNKNTIENLVKINNDLKSRLVDYENSAKLHTEDLKSYLKKNSQQTKVILDIEKLNKQLTGRTQLQRRTTQRFTFNE